MVHQVVKTRLERFVLENYQLFDFCLISMYVKIQKLMVYFSYDRKVEKDRECHLEPRVSLHITVWKVALE